MRRPQSLVWRERRAVPEGQAAVAPASLGGLLTMHMLLHDFWGAPNGSTSRQTWARSRRSERTVWCEARAAVRRGVLPLLAGPSGGGTC